MIAAIISFIVANSETFQFLLIQGETLATIAVGYGIIFESDKYPKSTHVVAEKLVICGIILETMFSIGLFILDDRIISIQNTQLIAQNEEIKKEITKRESRSVSDADLATLMFELKKIGGPFFLICRDDDETRQYCFRFESALNKSDLVEHSSPPVYTSAADWSGIVLEVPVGQAASDLQSDPLYLAFQKANIPVSMFVSGTKFMCKGHKDKSACMLICDNQAGICGSFSILNLEGR